MQNQTRSALGFTKTISLAACALAASLGGCELQTTDKDIVYLDSYQAIAKVNEKPGAFQSAKSSAFIDPRSREDYAKEHIAGAISLPFADMTLEAPGLLEKYQILVVYDTDYDDVLAKAASKRLLELRFKEVYTLEGGLKAWKRAGNEIATGVPVDAPELPDKPVE